MLNVALPYTGHPYELWREDGVLHVLIGGHARITVVEMKELLRLVIAMDESHHLPILIELEEHVQVGPGAKTLLARCAPVRDRAVAFLAHDLADLVQGRFFQRFHKPCFAFRVFTSATDAMAWLHSAEDHAVMHVVHA